MIYEFIAPIKTNIRTADIFEIFNSYMYKLGPKGLAVYLIDTMLKNDVQSIDLLPGIRHNKLILRVKVCCTSTLNPIQKGILQDFIESEFVYHVDKFMKSNKIDITIYNENSFYLKEVTKLRRCE